MLEDEWEGVEISTEIPSPGSLQAEQQEPYGDRSHIQETVKPA